MKVYIKPECYAEIMHYVHKSTIEISGLGRIQKASDGSMVVTSVYLLKQENGAASTDIDPDAMAELLYESRNDPGDLNFWWHSHVNMAVFWSGTDMATIRDFGSKGYLLSTVFNKKNEYRTSYYQAPTAFLPHVFVDDLDTEFGYVPTSAQLDTWNTQFDTLCTEKKWAPVSTITPGNYSGPRSYTKEELDEWERLESRYGMTPAAHKDPHYYKAEGFAGKDESTSTKRGGGRSRKDEVVGEHTGYTAAEMVKEIYGIRRASFVSHQAPTIADLDMMTMFMLYDLHEILEGQPTDDERDIQYLLDVINSSIEECTEVVEQFWDAMETWVYTPTPKVVPASDL